MKKNYSRQMLIRCPWELVHHRMIALLQKEFLPESANIAGRDRAAEFKYAFRSMSALAKKAYKDQ